MYCIFGAVTLIVKLKVTVKLAFDVMAKRMSVEEERVARDESGALAPGRRLRARPHEAQVLA